MISAGTIGGGAEAPAGAAPAPAVPAVPQVAASPVELGAGGVAWNPKTPEIRQGKETTDSLFSAMREQIHGNIDIQKQGLKNQMWTSALNGITNLGSQVFGWLTSLRFFQMQEHIADNAQEVEDRRSDNQVTREGRAFDAAERFQPQAMRLEKEVAQIHEDAETARYKERLRSQERQASVRDLPEYFMGRPSALG